MTVFVPQYNISLSSFVPNFRILRQVVNEISLKEKKFHRRERKMNKKGTDKQYVAAFLLHNTTHHYRALYQISES